MTKEITRYEEIPGAPKAVGPYSPAVKAGGFIYLSGQVPINPATGQLVGGGIEAETKQVLANLKAVLSEVGTTFDDVVKTVIFLTDLAHFQTVNALYSEALGGSKPARSTIQVAALPLGAQIEIEMVVLAK